MKKPDRQKLKSIDSFIEGADKKTPAGRPRRPKGVERKAGSKAKPSAQGYTRATFDLPDELHTRLKVAAAQSKAPMRDFVEEAVENWLAEKGY